MVKKRGQITMFILIGIVLIMIIGLFIYAKNIIESNLKNNQDEINKINSDKLSINNYIQNCIVNVAIPVIFEIAKKGGVLNPDSGIYWNGTQLNALAIYKTSIGYENTFLFKQQIERELSERITQDLKSCINLSIFNGMGYTISEGITSVNVIINNENLAVKLNYPLNFKIASHSIDFNDFFLTLDINLGELYAIAIDLLNEEIKSGHFDKDDFMLKLAGKIRIEKHKPYPNIVYIIKKFDKKLNKDLVFQFAIKGKDTVGKEVLNYKNKYGCCINKIDGMCFKNVEPSKCLDNTYENKIICACKSNTKQNVEGCCVKDKNCELTTEEECYSKIGKFHKNDLRCSEPNCPNLNCKSTYNYVTDDFSGNLKKHSESWCSYESIVGKGLDYVGTRHYLHSCINGIEYVEECRDYREELCAEGAIFTKGKRYSKGVCRINRWYDCSSQQDENSCKDWTFRDCYWSGFLYTKLKCHPEVPLGFKFWEGSGKSICNVANFDKDAFGTDYPISWGHSALLYCQRSGDCGNYRNVADEITEFGYYNRDIIPEQWMYWDNGNTKKGNDYIVSLAMNTTEISQSAYLPSGYPAGYARCDLWQAPAIGNCEECMKSKLHPCTEYKCKSLGQNCHFKSLDNSCGIVFQNLISLTIMLNKSSNNFDFTAKKSLYYPDGEEYTIENPLIAHKPFSFNFVTSKPTRCRLSIYPPYINQKAIASSYFQVTDILLNDYDYKSYYNITIRFPSSNFTKLNSYNLFLRCIDNFGIQNKEFNIKVAVQDPIDVSVPEILQIAALSNIVKNSNNTLVIAVDRPFNLCAYSFLKKEFDDMIKINCSTDEKDIVYNVNYPLGAYLCYANIFIPTNMTKIIFSCEGKNGNKGNDYVYSIS